MSQFEEIDMNEELNMDEELPNNSQGQEIREYTYKPGTIVSIKLINFMCHESFELELGPRVNFVIGPNGSGKSALLTALVIVLGGRATTTSRAKRANEFVMYGKKHARIICVIHNYTKIMEKDRAFKPDDYGKRIVVEKTLYVDATSKLVLKNDRDKKVSERKQELDDLLEHFGILINNPICILNQEISKNFLHSRKAEDKFDLFMKATNLEQIESDYSEAKHDHKSWGDCNDRKSVGFRVLDKEYMCCKEKISFLINRTKLQGTHKALRKELVWAMIRDGERKAGEIQQKISKHSHTIENLEAAIETSQNSIEKSKLRVEQNKEKLLSSEKECDKSKDKMNDIKRKITTNRMARVDLDNKISMKQREIKRLEDALKSLNRSISELKEKLNRDNGGTEENERRKLKMTQLEQEIPSEQAREKAIRQHTEQLSKSMSDTREEIHRQGMRSINMNSEITSKETTLRRLRNGERDALSIYGEHAVRICKEIESAHSRNRFKQRPLGPFGRYIKLKTPEVAPVLEIHLGRTAHAFVCDNQNDARIVHEIIAKVQRESPHNFKQPTVIVRKFGRRHDANKFKARHDQFKTLDDYVSVAESAVYNVLVDKSNLEGVLYIPDYKEAENLMITPPLVPKYTKSAYTKDLHIMHPRTRDGGYRSFALENPRLLGLFKDSNEDLIREVEKEIITLQSEKRDSENNRKRLDDSYAVQRKEYDSNQREITNILRGIKQRQDELLELRLTLTAAQPDELLGFESEVEAHLHKITDNKIELERLNHQRAQLLEEHDDLEKQLDSIMGLAKQRDADRQKILDLIKSERESMQKLQDAIRENELNIKLSKKRQEEDNVQLEKCHDDIATGRKNLGNSESPRQIRETLVVQAELKKVERQLNTEIEENTDPEELMESLQKRMREIENLNELRNRNTENYELSFKALKDRDDGFKSLRSFTCTSVQTTFASVMSAMYMQGSLKICCDDMVVDGQLVAKAKTLEISVDTTPYSQRPAGLTQNPSVNGPGLSQLNEEHSQNQRRRSTRSQPADTSTSSRAKRARLDVSPSDKENKSVKMADTRSLSGGERSFSTVAFVLALWHHCSSPFKLLDEIDVFMDMVTRRLTFNALIKFAQVTKDPGQFIYFSPLELPQMPDNSDDLVRVFEMPKIKK